MFVSKRRIILKTCGTTTPLLCLKSLLYLVQRYAGYDEVQVHSFVFWSHILNPRINDILLFLRICSTRAKITSARNCSRNRTALSRTRPPYWMPCFTVGGPWMKWFDTIFPWTARGLEFRFVRIWVIFSCESILPRLLIARVGSNRVDCAIARAHTHTHECLLSRQQTRSYRPDLETWANWLLKNLYVAWRMGIANSQLVFIVSPNARILSGLFVWIEFAACRQERQERGRGLLMLFGIRSTRLTGSILHLNWN